MSSTVTNIARASLRENKLRSKMIIVAIVFTNILLTSVGILSTSMSTINKASISKSYGTAHAYFLNMDKDKIEKLKLYNGVDSVGISTGMLGSYKKGENNYLFIYSDKTTLENSSNLMEKGNIPRRANEIALDINSLERLGYKGNIGEKIKLKYDNLQGNKTNKEFVLSGILPSKSTTSEGNTTIVVSNEFEKDYEGPYTVSFKLSDTKGMSEEDIESKINEIAKDIKVDEDNISVNNTYLTYMKPDFSVLAFAAVIALIVIMSAIIVIYNIFYISVVSKIQEYGRLKAIGATRKQIKSIIKKEGMSLCIKAIPIGTILGLVISQLIIYKLASKDNFISDIGIMTYVYTLIGSILLTLLTVYISLIKPMRMISKISVIEALKFTGNDRSKRKKRKGYINIDLIKLTKANLSRNKKRTIVTVMSLSLSGILIVTASSMMNSFNLKNLARADVAQDFEFEDIDTYFEKEEDWFNHLKMNKLDQNLIDKVKSVDGVKSMNLIKVDNVKIENKEGVYKEEYPNQKDVSLELGAYDYGIINILGNSLVEGKFDLEKIKNDNEVLVTGPAQHWYGFKVGDIIKVTQDIEGKKIEKGYKIQGVTNRYYGGDIITYSGEIKNTKDRNFNRVLSISVSKGKKGDIESSLSKIAKEYNMLDYKSFDETLKSNNETFGTLGAIGYALVAIIGAISLVNLINTILTSIISRKKEIGLLQSIGMSNKQLLKMFRIESLFYTLTTIASSLTIGSYLGYIAAKLMLNSGMNYVAYKFPLMQVIVVTIIMIIVQFIIGFVVNKMFSKESVIDRVRYND